MNYDFDEQAGEVVSDDKAIGLADTTPSQATEMAVAEQSGTEPDADAEADHEVGAEWADEEVCKTDIDRIFEAVDPYVRAGLLTQLAGAIYVEGDNTIAGKLEYAARLLGLVDDLQPRNGLEAILVTEILSLHQAGMEELKRANYSRDDAKRERHLNMSLKLFDKCEKLTAGMHKRRCGTEQRMSIDHLHRIVREDNDPKEVALRMIENKAEGPRMALVEQRPSFDIAIEQVKMREPEPVKVQPKKVRDA